MKEISQNIIQFAEKRKISKKTLMDLKIESGLAQFGNEKHESIVFGYYDLEGNRVNYKARAIHEKLFKQQKGGEQRFYNLENVLKSTNRPKTVFIVEGEFDALALYEAGFDLDCILSVPTGAVAKPTEEPLAQRKYKYVLDALEQGLQEVGSFVLLTDNDESGLALRQDLASILSHSKCKYYNFPEGIKDANEALIAWGKEDLKWQINEGLIDFPIEGVYGLDDIPDPPKVKLFNPKIKAWDDKFMLGAGMVSVFTGFPGHGKTSFAIQLWTNIAKEYNCTIGMFSGETRVKPYVRRNIRTFYHTKLEWRMTDEEKQEADDFIRKQFIFLNHPNNSPNFDWVCDKISDMKARFGISAFILDPWNKLDTPDFVKGSETQWIGRSLDYLTSLAKHLDIHIMILAHPSKPDAKMSNAPPSAYSIAGSAHWNNKPDHIFSLWRDKFENEDGSRNTEAMFTVCKTRYEELGYPRILDVYMNLDTGCFEGLNKSYE